MIVVDTNVIACAVVEGEHTRLARAVFSRDPDWAAPMLAYSDLRSVLVSCVRQHRMDLTGALAVLEAVEDALQERLFDVVSERVLPLALSSGCSSYDCEFVALAQALDVTLVTSDREVLRAFPRVARSPEAFAS